MSNHTTSDWILKVIAGPNQGAELLLESAQTLIGADDECDVVFRDVLVAPQHASLVIEGGQVFIEPLGGRVFLGGRRVREGRQKVDEFAFVTVGGTHFVLGREKSAWPLLSAADLPELEKEAPEAESAGDTNAEATAQDGDLSSSKPPAATSPQVAPLNKRAAWFGVGLGLILLAGSLFVYKRLNENGIVGLTRASVTQEDSQKVAVQQLLQDLQVDREVSVIQVGNRLTATGYVTSEEVRREVQARLRQGFPGMTIHVWSLDRIASTARKLLNQHELSLQVEANADGDLRVKGSTQNAAAWNKVKGILANEISGVNQVVDEVQVNSQAIVLKSDPPARVTEPQVDLDEDVPSIPEALAKSEDVRHIEFIQATPEEFGFMKLNDGSIMFLGARLQDGSTLVEIHGDKVTLLHEGEKRVVALGEKITKSAPTMKSAAQGGVN